MAQSSPSSKLIQGKQAIHFLYTAFILQQCFSLNPKHTNWEEERPLFFQVVSPLRNRSFPLEKSQGN